MPTLRKILYTVAYFVLLIFGGKGFIYILDSYPTTSVILGALILATGLLVLVGVGVFKEIRK